MDEVNRLFEFIDHAPTAFHAAQLVCRALEAAGYERLEERESWRLEPGRGYFTTRNRSSVVAFRLPRGRLTHFQIVASHGDSPALKLKPRAECTARGYAMLNVEQYGGALLSTWLDRPLSVAGRLMVRQAGGFVTKLVNVDRDLAMIPNVPIHFNRTANDGVALNPQVDMRPIYGQEGADIMAAVADAAGVAPGDIAASELFLYNRDRAARFGAEGEFISAPRLDDLECAFASLTAFLAARPSGHADVMCLFDSEEVGSATRQGADSTLLIGTLDRIMTALGEDAQALNAALAGSFMVSADNAHAVHPNHPEKYDDVNVVDMNGGVVVKSSARQKYATDGLSAAVFEAVCERAGVPVQRFANRSDMVGGSTLGNISNTHASMNTVDVGLAQMAMHSARETAGALDVDYMIRALTAFHEAEILVKRDGEILLK